MRVAFAVSTPHQVHLFKNTARTLLQSGNSVLFLARDYGCTLDLLRYYGLPFRIYSKSIKSYLLKVDELLISEVIGTFLACQFKPDIVVGDSLLGYPAEICRVPSICFADSDHSTFYNLLYKTAYRCDFFCTPQRFKVDLGRRQIRYPGYQELAYLHPNWYVPDTGVFDEVGVTNREKYSVVRFNAFDATSHDAMLAKYTWDSRRAMISRLERHGKVLISSECRLPRDLVSRQAKVHPARIHDLLNYAQVVVAESAMAVEAALLGTPSVMIHPTNRANVMASNFLDMEDFGLQHNFCKYDAAVDVACELLETSAKSHCQDIRDRVLQCKIDLTSFTLWLISAILQGAETNRFDDVDFSKFIGIRHCSGRKLHELARQNGGQVSRL